MPYNNCSDNQPRFRYSTLARCIAWANISIQALFPLAVSFTPAMTAQARQQPQIIFGATSRPYTLVQGESATSVADKFGISVDELRRLNQFRTFARGFDNIGPGEEVDVPLNHTNNKKNTAAPADEQAQKVASLASQTGSFLSSNPDGDAARSLVTSMATARANQEIQDWLGKFGTARVSLNADKKLSLKNSSLEMLYPLYDTPDNLFFTQGAIHRTDDRNQANLGFGWRHFAGNDWMAGGNLFVDHDLSRSHSRVGIGAEYWRDYLKLGANGYIGVTGWRNSPDVEDYEERPANGWDIHAEGYLPAYPQLGAKLMYEQYYGNEVGLFGKGDRQKNPHAFTAGVNYTPFPLMTVSAEHRQGKSGQNDTRVGLDLNYRIGEPLQKQLNTDAVRERRTLAGSRYDLVERNNNIVLEYRKKEVIRIALPDRIEGRGGQTVSLGLAVTKATHGLKHIQWDAPALTEAGGKITGKGRDWQVTLPAFRPGMSNTYTVAAVAYDNKDNASKRVQTEVVITGAGIDANRSSLTLDGQLSLQMMAGNEQAHTLKFSLRDAEGRPVTGLAKFITTSVEFKPAGSVIGRALNRLRGRALNSPVIGEFTEMVSGDYEATVTAGNQAGTGKFVVGAEGVSKSLDFEVRTTLMDVAASTFEVAATAGDVVADGQQTHTLTFTAKDAAGNPVTGDTSLRFVADDAAGVTIGALKEQGGVYTATVTSTRAGDITVRAFSNQYQLKDKVVKLAFVAGPADKTFSEMSVSASRVPVEGKVDLTLILKDKFGNLATTQPDALTPSGTAAAGTTVQGWTADGAGKWITTLTAGTTPGELSLMPQSGGSDMLKAPVDVTVSAGVLSPTNTDIAAASPDVRAGETVSLTLTAKDSHGNLLDTLPELTMALMLDGVADTTSVVSNWRSDKQGHWTADLTAGEKTGALTIMPQLNGLDAAKAPAQVTITAGTQAAAKSAVNLKDTTLAVDGTTTLTLQARDRFGNPVTDIDIAKLGIQVTGVPATDATIQGNWSAAAKERGEYTATLSAGTKAGSLTIMPQVDGTDAVDSSRAATLTVTAGPLVAGQSEVVAGVASLAVGGHTTLTLTAKDKYGNPVTGLKPETPTFSGAAMTAGQKPVTGSWTDNGNGTYTATLTVGDTGLGELTIMPRVNNQDAAKQAVSISITAGDPSAVQSTLTANQTSLTVKGTATLTLTAKDAHGHLISGLKPEKPVFGGVADDGKATTGSWTDNGNGTYTATLTVGEKAGELTVMPRINGKDAAARALAFTLSGDAATADVRAYEVVADNKPADGTSAAEVRFTVRDNYGNPVQGQTVTVTPAEKMNVLNSGDLTTDVNGQVIAKLASTLPGERKGTAKVGNHAGHPFTVSYAIDAEQTDLTLQASTVATGNGTDVMHIPANGALMATFSGKLTAKGHADVPLAGQTVTFVATPKKGTNGTLTIPDAVTDKNGTYSSSATSKRQLGEWDVKAVFRLNGKENTSTEAGVGFVAVTSNAQLNGKVTAAPQLLVVGETSHIQVKVDDGFGHPLKDQTVTFTVKNQDGSKADAKVVLTPENNGKTGEDGIAKATLTSTVANPAENPLVVTATIPQTYTNPHESSVQVIFSAKFDVSTATLTADTSGGNKAANGKDAYTLTATVKDDFGNPVNGMPVVFTLPQALALAAGESGNTKSTAKDGTATLKVVSTKAGTYSVTVKPGNNAASAPTALTFVADEATAMVRLDATGENLIADGVSQATLDAEVKDKYGNPVTTGSVTFSIDGVTGNDYQFKPSASVTPDPVSGIARAELTSTRPGSAIVNAVWSSNTHTAEHKTSVLFGADLAQSRVLLQDDMDGDRVVADNVSGRRFTATVMQGQVALKNQEVEIIVPDGVRVLDAAPWFTDDKGQVSFGVASRVAGQLDITVQVKAHTTSAATKAASFSADEKTAHITLLPDTGTPLPVAAGTPFRFSVAVEDAHGNKLDSGTVSYAITQGDAIRSSLSKTENALTGTDDTVEFTSPLAATDYVITATLTCQYEQGADCGLNGGKTATLEAQVKPDVASAVMESTLVSNNQPADGTTPVTVRYVLHDQYNNPLKGTAELNLEKASQQTVCAQENLSTHNLTFSGDEAEAFEVSVKALQGGDYTLVARATVAERDTPVEQKTTVHFLRNQLHITSLVNKANSTETSEYVRINTPVTLLATVQEGTCPASGIPVSFSFKDEKASKIAQLDGKRQQTVDIITNNQGRAEVVVEGKEAWTWDVRAIASDKQDGVTSEEKIKPLIGVENITSVGMNKTASSSVNVSNDYILYDSGDEIKFGDGSSPENYTVKCAEGMSCAMKSQSYRVRATTSGTKGRTITFTNKSTGRTLTYITPQQIRLVDGRAHTKAVAAPASVQLNVLTSLINWDGISSSVLTAAKSEAQAAIANSTRTGYTVTTRKAGNIDWTNSGDGWNDHSSYKSAEKATADRRIQYWTFSDSNAGKPLSSFSIAGGYGLMYTTSWPYTPGNTAAAFICVKGNSNPSIGALVTAFDTTSNLYKGKVDCASIYTSDGKATTDTTYFSYARNDGDGAKQTTAKAGEYSGNIMAHNYTDISKLPWADPKDTFCNRESSATLQGNTMGALWAAESHDRTSRNLTIEYTFYMQNLAVRF